ncbi:hypothetical protein [Streptomyces niveus]|uniref:hypothetical protein n=1 Tax=Streptomyces niveus TaxID=193462 RepID=UPI003789B27E
MRQLEGELEALCASVDDVFVRPVSRENLRAMVRGLLSEVPRKNLWQLAEAAGHPIPTGCRASWPRPRGTRTPCATGSAPSLPWPPTTRC